MAKDYVTHTCHNNKLDKADNNYCNNSFVDTDRYNCTNIPPAWRYCPKCKSIGFKNSKSNKND